MTSPTTRERLVKEILAAIQWGEATAGILADALIAAGVCFRDEVREEAAKECDEWARAVEAVSLGNTHARGQLFAYRNAAAALRAKAAPTEGE